jgi:hypothetical protein
MRFSIAGAEYIFLHQATSVTYSRERVVFRFDGAMIFAAGQLYWSIHAYIITGFSGIPRTEKLSERSPLEWTSFAGWGRPPLVARKLR